MDTPFSDPTAAKAALDGLILAKKLFTELDIQFWLSNGTLLGAIRDKTFIAHDSDIDIGVWADTDDNRIKRRFLESGFTLAQEFGAGADGHQLAFFTPGGVYFDIFFYVREMGRCWMPLWVSGKYRKMVFPPIEEFTIIEFLGHHFPIPMNYEAILTANYGDWRTPVPPTERGGSWNWHESPRNFE